MNTKSPRKHLEWFNLSRSLATAHNRIKSDDIPTPAELAGILEANAGKPLPPWFVAVLTGTLRGEIKRKRGRKQKSDWDRIFIELAKWDYGRHLAWLKRRKKSQGLKGWSCIRDQHWWQGPPHERALAILYEDYCRRHHDFRFMSIRRFRNLISSQQ